MCPQYEHLCDANKLFNGLPPEFNAAPKFDPCSEALILCPPGCPHAGHMHPAMGNCMPRGAPQCTHVLALLDIGLPHSRQVIIDIIILLIVLLSMTDKKAGSFQIILHNINCCIM